MKRLILLLLVSCLAPSAFARQVRMVTQDRQLIQTVQNDSEPRTIHVTPMLLQSEEGQAALKEYHRRRELGLYPAAKTGATYQIGETKNFLVRNLRFTSPTFDTIEFTLKLEEGRFNVWVETDELNNGNVRPEDIEALRVPLGEETPIGSFDPTMGIIENNETVFGPPSDVDGNGRVDVMVLDIRDDYDPDNGNNNASVGFFDPVHLTGRNLADQVFLDTYPGLVSPGPTGLIRRGTENIVQTFAHEYQHLIFAVTHNSGDTFVNEGLAEWAEVMNGYTARGISYFQKSSEWERSFLDWREGGGPSQEDYQRAGLFTNYISERIGVLNTGVITRSSGFGPINYIQVLSEAGLDLKDILTGFHVANAINDLSVAPEYGYTTLQYSGVRISSIPTIDGTTATTSPTESGSLRPGSVEYARWDNVADFVLDIAGNPNRLKAILIAEPETGVAQVIQHEVGSEVAFVSGQFDRITLVLAHADITTSTLEDYSYSAEWRTMEPSFITHEFIFDDGTFVTGYNFLESTGQIANRFEVPPGSFLNTVSIDVPYEHNFSGSTVSNSAPRDYVLHVWAENASGLPGNELFSLEVQDLSVSGGTVSGSTGFSFQMTDLTQHQAELSSLPPVVFIGISNTGTDLNYIGASISVYSGIPSPSFMYHGQFGVGGGWRRFDDIVLCTNADCSETRTMGGEVLPIRATFKEAVNTAIADESVLPERVALEQNYPNPFNPSTSIRYSLPTSGNVKLSIYDMLGRRVATLMDGFQPSGQHEISFDAGTFASGLYLYALETGSAKFTRTMMLIK